MALMYSLKSGSMMPPALFFLMIALATWDICDSTQILRLFVLVLQKNAMSILIGILLNLQIASGKMDILTTLIFPINDYGISFHLCFI